MTSNPERDLHTYLAADVAHSESAPPLVGGLPRCAHGAPVWACNDAPAGPPLHESADRDASDVPSAALVCSEETIVGDALIFHPPGRSPLGANVPSDRVRAYAEAFRARKGPRCAECVELDDWSDCAECDAVVAVEVAELEQAELRAEVERLHGRLADSERTITDLSSRVKRREAELADARAEIARLKQAGGSDGTH